MSSDIKIKLVRDGVAICYTPLFFRESAILKAGEYVEIFDESNPLIKKTKGLVLNVTASTSDIMLLGSDVYVKEGFIVKKTNELLKLKVSLNFFGNVINSLGEYLEKKEELKSENITLIEKKATGIIDRKPVRKPLLTGLKAVDSLVPIGRGQRELIIGDRQTGKSSVGIDAIINYSKINKKTKNIKLTKENLKKITWFIYAAIGQKQSTISGIKNKLKKYESLWYTSIISASASDAASLQFLAPYSASAVGEFIRDSLGADAVVIFDDLSKHAVAYRQMSLLLRRPPGREAFPGDVFYVHSRLLERAGALRNKCFKYNGSIEFLQRGTLTALPIIETQAGDVSAYIPTNVISITDGQIFLETDLFYKGVRPAINVGLSVSRVGSAAQPALMKNISGSLKIDLAQFREIENFAKLGANLDEHTKRLLTRGENLIEILKQNIHEPQNVFSQILSIFLGTGYSGPFLNKIKTLKIKNFVNVSWLELLRNTSDNFNITDVNLFINKFLKFINKSILFQKSYSENFNNTLNDLLLKTPFLLNDFVNYYLLKVKYNKNVMTSSIEINNSNVSDFSYKILTLFLYKNNYFYNSDIDNVTELNNNSESNNINNEILLSELNINLELEITKNLTTDLISCLNYYINEDIKKLIFLEK